MKTQRLNLMPTKLPAVLLVLAFTLSACSSPTPAPATRAVSSPPATSTSPAATATHVPGTLRPTRQAGSPTRTPTAAPTHTFTATAVPEFITNRQPSIQDVFDYVSSKSELSANSEWPPIYSRWLDIEARLIHEDLNGDGEADMLLDNSMEVVVFLWLQDHYSFPYQLLAETGIYGSSSRILLEDWTADDTPEIIFDHFERGGGSDAHYVHWRREIISCQGDTCHIAWWGYSGHVFLNFLRVGAVREKIDFQPFIQPDGTPAFKWTMSGWSMSTPGWMDIQAYDDPQYDPEVDTHVYTSTQTIFAWDGTGFTQQPNEVITPHHWIEPHSALSAKSRTGDVATIQFEPGQYNLTEINGSCQVLVNDQPLGEPIPCKKEMTELQWRQVVGDGRQELVVSSVNGVDMDYMLGCPKQRLQVYAWGKRGQNSLVADVEACIMQPDTLFGVRLEDVDGDEQVEILAANESWFTPEECMWNPEDMSIDCWYELQPLTQRIYRWDGDQFVLDTSSQ